MRTKPLFCFCLGLAVLRVFGANAQAAEIRPSAIFSGASITVTNITPGSNVVFFGVGLEPQGFYSKTSQWSQVVGDSTRSGAVSLHIDHPIPWKSIWVIVDLTSGHYSVTAPPKFPIQVVHPPENPLHKDAAGLLDLVRHPHSFVDALYVTAGGAWTINARDGYDTDSDGQVNGVTTINLGQMTALTPGATLPHEFTPGGTVFLIDPLRLDILELPVDASLVGGAQ